MKDILPIALRVCFIACLVIGLSQVFAAIDHKGDWSTPVVFLGTSFACFWLLKTETK